MPGGEQGASQECGLSSVPWPLRSLSNNIWTEHTQGCPLLQPPTSFPVATFGISHSASLGLQGLPTAFSELSSLPISCERPDSSELLHQDGGHRQHPGQHAFAGLPHLPLSGLLLRMAMQQLWWARVISPKAVQEAPIFLKRQDRCNGWTLSGTCKSLSRMRAGKTQEPR